MINVKQVVFILVSMLISLSSTFSQEVRNSDGFGNNKLHPEMGTAGSMLKVLTSNGYTDKISSPAAPDRMNPRIISNILFAQDEIISDSRSLSDYNWVFGQFIDHDVTLVENAERTDHHEGLVIVPPFDDKFFGPGEMIFMMRSKTAEGTGTSEENPRRHNNEITSFIDGSGIYGSDDERQRWLRTFNSGKLKTSQNNLLPWNTIDGEFNSPVDPNAPFMGDDTHSNTKLFVAGDVRANENPLLIALHTLFVREHNRVCDVLKEQNPSWDDEQLFQHARRLVSGILQNITYNEWLPAMGIYVPEYNGYNDQIDPSASNVFSAAAFRMGHTLLNSDILRMKDDGDLMDGSVKLRDAFFNPFMINLTGGIDPFLKGMGTQKQQELDCKVIDDVRNFLFGKPGEGGLDLAAININRGRERGLPDYNTIRADFGLPKVKSFEEICVDPSVNTVLKEAYGNVDNIDPWVGMLAEDHMKDAIFGELCMTIIEKQFRHFRDGDRFYYLNDEAISSDETEFIESTNFHNLIMRNTDIKLMQDKVFVAMEHENIPNGPELERKIIAASIFPNPVDESSRIKLFSMEETSLTVNMYDNLGNTIMTKKVNVAEGDNFLEFNFFTGLPSGAYNIKIENDLGIYTILRAIL